MGGVTDKPIIFIQFAGQGVRYMEELRRLYTTCPDIQPFMHEAIGEIQKQAAEYDDTRSRFFDQGLDVGRWITHPEETPDFGYLQSSPLSHPLIYLCQISNYISIVQEGLDQEMLLRHTHSATGFSTGVVAAILASMGLPLPELWKWAIKVQAMFFWQGVRCQQCTLNFGERPYLEEVPDESSEGSPSCMASINGLSRAGLDELIQGFSDIGTVYPAYELLKERWIVSGMPDDLVAFRDYLKREGLGITWKFTSSTIGAHSPFLSYALETSPLDAKRVGLAFTGSDMKVPVWSNDTGTDLRSKEDIVLDVMRAYFTCPALWRHQIAPLYPPSTITHVLDFGPGTGVASLTENHITGSGIQVIRCSLPLGRKLLFSEILPALDR